MNITCPRCRTSAYRNPTVKFMVNTCGHSLCTNCVELQFNRGSGKCEVCRTVLKKSNFRPQTFGSSEVERGVFIRKKILKDFNKTQKDFDNDRDYNDYLEEVETIIYNLSHGIDVEEMNQRVEKFREEEAAKKIKGLPDEAGKEMLGGDKKKEEEEEEEEESVVKNFIIDDSSRGAHPTKIQADKADSAYQYKELIVDIQGPLPPSCDQLDQLGYVEGMPRATTDVEYAGGFTLQVACHKTLSAAMTGLYVFDRSRT